MKSVRLLHISDLHMRNKGTVEKIGLRKDQAVSNAFCNQMLQAPEYNFKDFFWKWQKKHGKIDAIVCSGDLGDRGEEANIKKGMMYVSELQEKLGVKKNNVLICPGNHDAQRKDPKSNLFKYYLDALKEYGFRNHLNDKKPCKIKGIPFLVLNSCLGAGQKSLFIGKYKELVEKLSDEDRAKFNEELKSVGITYLDDYLDIPAVTNNQIDRINEALMNDESGFVVLVMHHSLIPCNSVEIRPYSTVLDAGKVLKTLCETNKDSLILHGHVHFQEDSVVFKPRNIRNNFVSSIGTGKLTFEPGSSANIIDIVCSDEGEHYLTIIHEFIMLDDGLSEGYSYGIFNKYNEEKGRDDYDDEEGGTESKKDTFTKVRDLLNKPPRRGHSFKEIKKELDISEGVLVRTILQNERIFQIDWNNNSNIDDWIIHRNN